ncbi:MAG: helix-turn-helix domain-containing protein [Candidatus Omnitrophica bacterium]|nr:helix-turn-helix domain-containing protein [Candidatus Omnitrophota bacterium]
MTSIRFKEAVKVWPKVSKSLTVPHNDKEYNRAVHLLDELIDTVGEDEKHPLSSLLEVLAVVIENYENQHYAEPEGSPDESLKYLMAEHGIKQSDLKEIGSQGVVSEILSGKRKLNMRQIKLLAKRFSVSPAVFI